MKFFTIFTLLFVVTFTFAQEKPKRILSIGTKCIYGDSGYVDKNNPPVCDNFTKDNSSVQVITHNNLKLAAVLFDDGDYYGADIYIENLGKDRIEISRSAATMAYWKSHDIAQPPFEIVEPTAPEKIAKSIKSRARWGNFFGALGAGMRTQTATVNTQGNGTNTQSTVTVPDNQAQAEENNRARERNAVAGGEAAGYLNNALKSNTLFEGSNTNGLIYFKRNKKAKMGVFSFIVNGFHYDFMFKQRID